HVEHAVCSVIGLYADEDDTCGSHRGGYYEFRLCASATASHWLDRSRKASPSSCLRPAGLSGDYLFRRNQFLHCDIQARTVGLELEDFEVQRFGITVTYSWNRKDTEAEKENRALLLRSFFLH